jgi:hypothetical protein
MAFWEAVDEVPHDGDASYLEAMFPGPFNVGVADLDLQPCERIAAIAGALCWRNAGNGAGRPVLYSGADQLSVSSTTPAGSYHTVFVFSRAAPDGAPWARSRVNGVMVGAVAVSGMGLRATQVGLHVFLHTPPVVLQRKERAMNFLAKSALVADGSDQAVDVPRGGTLIVHPLAANVEVRDVAGAAAKLTIPADSMVMLGPSYGQTVYLRAAGGTVIELAVT